MRFSRTVAAGIAWLALTGFATAFAATDKPAPEHDGAHDFDFNAGLWQTHITRRLHPLSGSTESIDMKGTVDVQNLFEGRARLEQIEVDGPQGHWEGMSVFLYDPAAHEWSQTFINSARGEFSHGLIGSFKDGRGELFGTDTFDGRSILVRGVWSNITADGHRYEESYSDDGGKTWEIEFSANLTRKSS